MHQPKYRHEIDGLRAIAVMSVVFYHAGFEFIKYGYLGVDLFFVISGYVITRIVLYELVVGKFTFLAFYDRRIRRIIPLVTVVSVLFLIIFYFNMLPWDYENFAAEFIATTFFSNNILHYITSANYWGIESQFKALMHTWSLGVEEQFYFLLPVSLFFTFNKPRWLIIFIILGISVSFFLMIIFQKIDSMAAFFLLPFRAWQLLVGVITAYIESRINISPRQKGGLELTSVLILILSAVSYSDNYSSYTNQLIIMIGSSMLILGMTERSTVGKLMTRYPLKQIGTLSFSIYMWHQPIFVLGRLNSLTEPTPSEHLKWIVLALMCSIVSKRFIEDSFRNQKKWSNKVFYTLFGIIFLTIVPLAGFIYNSGGLPTRWSTEIGGNVSGRNANVFYNVAINDKYYQKRFPNNGKKNIIVIGNSFARDFLNVLTVSGVHVRNNLSYFHELEICGPQDLDAFYNKFENLNLRSANYVIFGSAEYMIYCQNEAIKDLINNTSPEIIIVGTKSFGYSTVANLKKFPNRSASAGVEIPAETNNINQILRRMIGDANFVNIQDLSLNDDGYATIFDAQGNLLSFDTRHLTEFGAQNLSSKWLTHQALSEF